MTVVFYPQKNLKNAFIILSFKFFDKFVQKAYEK